jgi:virginiamycin B lyase
MLAQDVAQGISMLKHFLPLIALSILLLLLSACGDGENMLTGTNPAPTMAQPASTAPAPSAQGTFAEYPLPQDHSSIMRPVVDHEGRVWFGEMGRNYLAYFDPQTQRFHQMTPPQGANGIMGIAVASDDTIWFAEQYANYIGHYFPTTGRYQIYHLPVLHKPDPGDKTKTLSLPTAPNDIVLDKQGNVWFTEMNADAIGVLHVKTGQFTHYPLSSPPTIQNLNPYGITIDPQGNIWFTEANNNRLGHFNPKTGAIKYYQAPATNKPLMEVASDSHGNIWATSFSSGLLLAFNPTSGQFTSYSVSANNTNTGGIYGLTISPDNEVWITVTSASAIARLDPQTNHFVYYQTPTGGSLPFGIAMNNDHTLWFTESGVNKIGSFKYSNH